MGTFNTQKLILASPSLIPAMSESIVNQFTIEGYEVQAFPLASGGYDVSITKGGTFKAVLGMKSALKVSLLPQNGNVFFDASVGIFGQQVIPTVISMFVFWPVLLTQIWGMVNQSHLDDKALKIAENVARVTPVNFASSSNQMNKFCTNCGHPINGSEKFCSECGSKL